MKPRKVSENPKKNQSQNNGLPNIPAHQQYSPTLFRPASHHQSNILPQNRQSSQSVTMQNALLEDDEAMSSEPPQNIRLFSQVRAISYEGERYLEKTVYQCLGNEPIVKSTERLLMRKDERLLPPVFLNAQFAALRFAGAIETTKVSSTSDSFDTLSKSFSGGTRSEMETSIRDFKLPSIIAPSAESPQQRIAK